MPWQDRLFLALSGVQHRIRSFQAPLPSHPFFSELQSAVFEKARHDTHSFWPLEALRTEWKHSQEKLGVKDLGAGSHTIQKSQRPVAKMARHSLSPAWFSRLLHFLITHYQLTTVAELGTSLGLNSLYLHQALPPHGELHTFEGCPNTLAWAQKHFDGWNASRIHTHLGNLDITWPVFLANNPTLDLVYLDANHREAPTVKYFEACLPYLSSRAIVVVDDLYWSSGMHRAWQRISQHPQVQIAIDLFEGGLLFFDPNLPKTHLRYHLR